MSLENSAADLDRRQFGRRLINFDGWIRIPGRPSMHCTVRDISEAGAKLACELPRTLPYRFDLIIPVIPVHLHCEIRNCTDTTVGVLFRRPEDRKTTDDEIARSCAKTDEERLLASMTGRELVAHLRAEYPVVQREISVVYR